MFAGGVLSWLVLLPLLSILGQYITVPFPPIHPNFANNPATGRPFLISEMAPGADLERLHPLHRRRRGAGGGSDHAGADDSDDRPLGAEEA